jgi:hypothetical protein
MLTVCSLTLFISGCDIEAKANPYLNGVVVLR